MSAADRIVAAVQGVMHGDHSRDAAVASVSTDDLAAVLHTSFGPSDDTDGGAAGPALCVGIAASPGVAVGKVCLTMDQVLDVVDGGEEAIFVASETSPADEVAMKLSSGILTARGGLASHAAVVARGWGIAAVCGAQGIELIDGGFVGEDGTTVMVGDTISLDGSAGQVQAGGMEVTAAEAPPETDQLLAWADDIRAGHVGVRANADNGEDAARAVELGADGIGLCRTEHMFLGERLPYIQALLGADDEAARVAALAELERVQREDFTAVLEAMDGLPVTVRLLDAPLHEFLEESHEENPMLGLRGVRLAMVTEGLYATQVRALMQAAAIRAEAGGTPVVEIMVPLITSAEELAAIKTVIDAEVAAAAPLTPPVLIGTMIETPRAALRAGDLAHHTDFVSFGTNDLTQMTFGFSRDDVESSVIVPYIEKGLLDRSPFDALDQSGVGELVAMGVERGRAVKPDLKCGICGEHGGDPSSIAFVIDAGLDYVSCSAPRLPIARLAAAQAVLSRS